MKTGVVPTDGMVITESTTFTPGVYHLPNGIRIGADNIFVDGGGALIIGSGKEGKGVIIEGKKGVTITNLSAAEYYHGIYAKECEGLKITKNRITATAEIAPNTIFLDIWLKAEVSYGGAIFLWKVTDSLIEENDIQHQMNGLLTYSCSKLNVRANQANYNSGFGIHLNETCDSLFELNSCDYCCRYEPREGGRFFGHMGADATGFLIIYKSCRNIFRYNQARLGGDAFFLAGLSADGEKANCSDNLFEENDGSLSPNIAFEATFSSGNVFRKNKANRGNFGFWLGFSWDNIIEDNEIILNRIGGIAVENGSNMQVRRNNFQANQNGLLLWSHYVKDFDKTYPELNTSYNWTVEENTFTRNTKGIRIGADQDHGIRNYSPENCGPDDRRPHDHFIRKNDIQDNRIGIELYKADRTIIEGNILNKNVEANLREDDATETTFRNNLGARGAYL